MTDKEKLSDLVRDSRAEVEKFLREIADLKALVIYWYSEAKGYRHPVDDEELLKSAIREMDDGC